MISITKKRKGIVSFISTSIRNPNFQDRVFPNIRKSKKKDSKPIITSLTDRIFNLNTKNSTIFANL